MKQARLRTKLLLGTTIIAILLALTSMLAVSWVVSQQYREQANELLSKAGSIIDDQLAERKNSQLYAARQLATQKSFVSTLWYLSKYVNSGVDQEMLVLTRQQLVKEINKLSLTERFSKVAVYDADGLLVAFVQDDGRSRQAGFVEDYRQQVLQVAALRAGEELSRDNQQKSSHVAGLALRLGGIAPQPASARYVVTQGRLAIESQMRIVAGGLNPQRGIDQPDTVGWMVTVQPIGQDFSRQLAKLTHTQINWFIEPGLSYGDIPAYRNFDSSVFSGKKTSLLNEIDVGGERFYQAMRPLYSGERLVGAVAALQSEKIVQRNVREMIGILGLITFASLLLIFPFVWYFADSIARPLTVLSLLFREVASDKVHSSLSIELFKLEKERLRDDELGDLTQSFMAMDQAVKQKMRQINEINASLEEKVSQRTQELRIANEALTRLAMHDALTGLPNRQLLGDRLAQSLVAAQREMSREALLFIDLDDFKPINDNYGHAVGDLVLKEAAVRIQRCVRASDTVARIGGDEFVVLLSAVDGTHDAVEVAEKICEALRQPFVLLAENLHISCSIGVALYPDHASTESQLCKHADQAMYAAKNSGRNQVCLYNGTELPG